MQKVLTTVSAAHRNLRTGLATLLLCGVAATAGTQAQAQFVASPVGTVWDCVLSGSGQKGVAFITFTNDPASGLGTFSGYQILAPAATSSTSDGRNPAGGIGRVINISGTNITSTNLFGFDQFNGPWAFDANGKVIGHFAQEAGVAGSTNNAVTNGVSFSAKVVSGKRLTLVAYTSNGKITYRGVPYAGTISFDGAWYGNKRMNQQWFTEFYTFASVAESNPFPDDLPDLSDYPGIYFTQDGIGPSYEIQGFAMLSTQKKIAFAFQNYPPGGTNGVLNASFGTLSRSSSGKLKASTVGIDDSGATIRYTFMQPIAAH